MTRTRYHIFEDEYPYFMTCTIVGWVPVFTALRPCRLCLIPGTS